MTCNEASDVVLEDDADCRLLQPNQPMVINNDIELQNEDLTVHDLAIPDSFPPPEWPGTGNLLFMLNFGTLSSLPVPLSSTASSTSSSLSNTSSLARWQRLPREERRSNPYPRSRRVHVANRPNQPCWHMQDKSYNSGADSYHLEDHSHERSWHQEASRDSLIWREPRTKSRSPSARGPSSSLVPYQSPSTSSAPCIAPVALPVNPTWVVDSGSNMAIPAFVVNLATPPPHAPYPVLPSYHHGNVPPSYMSSSRPCDDPYNYPSSQHHSRSRSHSPHRDNRQWHASHPP
ncbi:uncharacterized protein EI90DRAFT_3127716 [Cantharellus anzutake]|uniref:uncharacterized protein n=1 Tax=Cantharellus anzutake TaxID=1750568 RepID=UPI001908DE8C|nr:uncharacterized protein EI90DRAFT_3127716 [Cantharellus anzutake]KAF8326512.1 hypothetical protein EI90DRAFT_3127716 [Cantharellus anzutake]